MNPRLISVSLLAALLVALLALGHPVRVKGQGNLMMLGAGATGAVAAAGTYQGPGDVVSGAVAFYSCRAYSAAKVGTKAYRLFRTSDSTQQDINSLASGKCDTATPATFCNSTACTYVTFYDQTGALACAGSTACDATQATQANQNTWTASSLNGWPCAVSPASVGAFYATANALVESQPFTMATVSERTSNFTTNGRLFSSASDATTLGYRTTTNTIGANGGTVLTNTASDSAFHALIGVFSTTVGAMVVDGSTTGQSGTTTGAGTMSGVLNVMSASGGASRLNGVFCEGGIWPAALNSTQYGNLNTNMHGAANGWNF